MLLKCSACTSLYLDLLTVMVGVAQGLVAQNTVPSPK